MIETMHNLTVVCLAADKDGAVEKLRELGSVHVVDTRAPDSADLAAAAARHERAERALMLLKARSAGKHAAPVAESAKLAESAESLAGQALALAEDAKKAEEAMARWNRAAEMLAPWGSFSRETLARLAGAGIQVRLGTVHESQLNALKLPEGAVFQEISRPGGIVHFAVTAPAGVELAFPEAALPEETDAERIRANLAAASARLAAAERDLDGLRSAVPALARSVAELKDELELLRARDGMGAAAELAYLNGFVPVRRLPELQTAANQHGWAVQDREADRDDASVPTLITLPRLFNIAKPIFDFIGISPKYSETDVSVCFLIFLVLFFGMIVGDAGYGVLFLAAGLWMKRRFREPEKQLPANLFIAMAVSTIAWGWLGGNWCAIPAERLPLALRGIPWFTDAPVKDQNVQYFCFLIAAVHLSIARLWKALLNCRRKDGIGHLGWAMLIWANFFMAVSLIVKPGSFPKFGFVLYGAGVALILACGVDWKDIGGVLNLPFGLIGSFVDVLSYIRLFAVGLASYLIAYNFNEMGKMVYAISPWMLPGAVLVIFFGHVLNIVLALMSVLVHGIRLNTLEFSNHMELTWSGLAYKPLRKNAG